MDTWRGTDWGALASDHHFPTLEYLQLQTSPHILKLLAPCLLQGLKHLAITLSHQIHLASVLMDVCKRLNPQLLERFELSHTGRFSKQPQKPKKIKQALQQASRVVPHTELSPLYRFQKLNHLTISIPFVEIALNDQSILDLFGENNRGRWPYIKVVKLSSCHRGAVGYESLVGVLRLCPNLTNLTLPWDVSSLPSHQVSRQWSDCDAYTNLNTLNLPTFVNSDQLGDQIKLASFLAFLAPNLKNITFLDGRTSRKVASDFLLAISLFSERRTNSHQLHSNSVQNDN